MELPIPLIGQSYQHRNLPISAQTLKNWYVEINRESQAAISLQPWPGLTARLTTGGDDGGMHVFNDVLYKVTENTLYKVNSSNWSGSSIGTIAGSGLCSFVSNADTMVIVRAGNVYRYDGSTLTKATDTDFENPDFVAYLNSQAIYDADEGRFCVSDPGSLTTIDGLNFATAEKAGDILIRPYEHSDRILMFGRKTIEPWWNSGRGNPPLDPIQGSLIKKGLMAGHSVASNSRYLYFLGDDFIVYRIMGTQLERPVSTIPLAQTFRSYGADAQKAVGHCFAIDGQQFYYLHFPGKGTWCYCQDSDGWHQLTTSNDESPYAMTGYAEAYGKQLFSKGGNIYSLEPDVYTNADETILRERVSFLVSAELLGKQFAGRKLQMDSLELVVKTVAPVTGQGSSPKVMVSYSDNNGRTWSNERQMQAATAGTYTWRLVTQQLGQFYERLIRVRISDPIVSSVLGCKADVGLCIG